MSISDMRISLALKRVRRNAGNRGPGHPGQRAGDEHRRQQPRPPVAVAERQREAAAGDAAERDLSFGADVPDVGAKADREARAISISGVAFSSSSRDAVRVATGCDEKAFRAPRTGPGRAREDDESDDSVATTQSAATARPSRRDGLGARLELMRLIASGRRAARRRMRCDPRHQQADFLGIALVASASAATGVPRRYGDAGRRSRSTRRVPRR